MAENRDYFNKSALIFKILYSEQKTGGGPIYPDLCQWEHSTGNIIGSSSRRWLHIFSKDWLNTEIQQQLDSFAKVGGPSLRESFQKSRVIRGCTKAALFWLVEYFLLFCKLVIMFNPTVLYSMGSILAVYCWLDTQSATVKPWCK